MLLLCNLRTSLDIILTVATKSILAMLAAIVHGRMEHDYFLINNIVSTEE